MKNKTLFSTTTIFLLSISLQTLGCRPKLLENLFPEERNGRKHYKFTSKPKKGPKKSGRLRVKKRVLDHMIF